MGLIEGSFRTVVESSAVSYCCSWTIHFGVRFIVLAPERLAGDRQEGQATCADPFGTIP